MEPVGAVRMHSVELAFVGFCQKEAREPLGGPVTKWAGDATDTEVSETSVVLVEPNVDPYHSQEQVAKVPWEAEGDQMEIWFSLTDPKREKTVVFETQQMVPAEQAREFTVMAVAVELDDVNR